MDVREDKSDLPPEVEQHLEKAYTYEEIDEFDKALTECELAIELAPNLAEAHNLRGVVLEELNRKEEAIVAYREAVRLDPDWQEAQENLLEAEAELKEETEELIRIKVAPPTGGMRIKGIARLMEHELSMELERGGKFVIFQYCISGIAVTLKRSSHIYFIRADENPIRKGIGFTVISLLFGWWGIPWGPICTLQVLAHNLGDAKDVTKNIAPKVIASMAEYGLKPFQICPNCNTDNSIDASVCKNCKQPMKLNVGGRILAVVLTVLFILLGVILCYSIYVEGL